MMILAVGMGFMFVPITLMVVSHVPNQEQGAASGLLNTGQQIGGAIGLAAIGTVAWTSVAHSITGQMAAGASGAAASGAAASDAAAGVPTSVLFQALTTGFSTGLLVAAGVVWAGFVVAIVTTWTPGGWRLRSAVHQDGEQPCDDALGTCEAIGA